MRYRETGTAAASLRLGVGQPAPATPSAPHSTLPGWAVRVLRGPRSLEPLRAPWRRLDRDRPGPGSELDWVQASAVALEDPQRLHVVALFERDRLTGVAPFLADAARIPRLRLSDDAGGFLYRDHASLRRLVDAVLALGKPLVLGPLVANGATETALLENTSRRLPTRSTTRLGGPSLGLDASRPDPSALLSKSRAKDLRRRERAARKLGDLRFEAGPPAARLADVLDEFVALEAAGWKGREGTALRDDPQQRWSLLEYLGAPDVIGRARVARLCIDGRTIAIDVGLIAANRYWSIKTTYDESFSRCSPGHLMTLRLIEWAATQGLDRFEFCGETAPAKEMWGAPAIELRMLKVYPPTLAGVSALGADAGGKVQRKVVRSLPGRR